ncbi:uncharacterized protein N7498_004142 [Penicillium cinerascens]|uniref:BTB domain-containing protein n=1 Tax=Penicillium cinerascens TaxID=70096 RepID=A0A9W9T7T4_9EURO|nr:uncharacterized protein N7498_004142 [Penicillium cinerascens]KAJ5212496.1 hypothetical protein N7498_004142 [Penicillium cinerascens]
MRPRILQFGIFHVFTGKDRKRFLIHRVLECSFPSKALQPSMIEDIDEVVFGCCCEFVYSDDYSCQKTTSSEMGGTMASTLDRKIFHPTRLPGIYALLLERLDQAPRSEDEEDLNTESLDSCADLLLSHAKMYRFGFRIDWLSLWASPFYWLMRSLENFTLLEEGTKDIVQLLQFFFEDSEHIENMRGVLRDYVVWKVEIMVQDADFQKLLERIPSLEKAVFRSTWKYSDIRNQILGSTIISLHV